MHGTPKSVTQMDQTRLETANERDKMVIFQVFPKMTVKSLQVSKSQQDTYRK